LKNGGSKNDEMSRGMQEAVEASVGEVRLGETERKRSKRGSRKKTGRKRK